MIIEWMERSSDAVSKWPFRWPLLILMVSLLTYSHIYQIITHDHVMLDTSTNHIVLAKPSLDDFIPSLPNGLSPDVIASVDMPSPLIIKDNVDAIVVKALAAQNLPINPHTAGLPKGSVIWTNGTQFKVCTDYDSRCYTHKLDTYWGAVEQSIKWHNRRLEEENEVWVKVD